MNKFLKVSFGIISVITLLFLNFGLAHADECSSSGLAVVEGTKRSKTDGWRCVYNPRAGHEVRKSTTVFPCPRDSGTRTVCEEIDKDNVGCVNPNLSCTPPPTAGANNVGTTEPGVQSGQELRWTIKPYESTSEQNPGEVYVDGNIPQVDITFYGLNPKGDDVWLFGNTKQEDVSSAKKLSKVHEDGGTLKVTVCAASNDSLKGKALTNKDCKTDGSDYFHEGKIYRLGLYDDEFGQAQIMVAEFYVYHSAPHIKITNIPTGPSARIRVDLSGRRLGKDEQNNYQIVLKNGGDVVKKMCYSNGQKLIPNKTNPLIPTRKISPETNQKDFTTPLQEANPRNAIIGGDATNQSGMPMSNGKPITYTLQINDQVSDSGLFTSSCSGGFIYVEIPVTASATGITIGAPEFDPNGSDKSGEEKLSSFSPAPCAKADPKDKTKCLTVRTAIGDIDVTPEGLVRTMFKFILMLAGFGGIIIIIYSGYMLITSRGDKEKLAAARETLTSAIVGLLFIILSIVILEIIGVDILRIPGFAR